MELFHTPFAQSFITIEELTKTITSDYIPSHFNQILKRSGAELLQGDPSLFQNLVLDKNAKYLILKDFQFDPETSPLVIKAPAFHQHIIFANCSFSGIQFSSFSCVNLIFIQCSIYQQLTVINKSTINHLQLQSVAINGVMLMDESTIGQMKIPDNCKIFKQILSIESEIEKLVYEGTTNATEISFLNSRCTDLNITGHCQSIRVIQKSLIQRLELINTKLDKQLHCHHVLISTDSTCNDIFSRHFNCVHFIVQEKSTIGKLDIYESIIGNLFLQESFIKHFLLYDSMCTAQTEDLAVGTFRSNNTVYITFKSVGELSGKFYFSTGQIGNLLLHQSVLTKDSIFSVSNIPINLLSFKQILVSGQLQFKEINSCDQTPTMLFAGAIFPSNHMMEIAIRIRSNILHTDFNLQQVMQNMEPKLGFESRPVAPECSFLQSSMGKTEFIGCDLSRFRFNYKSSKLLDMFIAGSSLPKNDHQIFTNELETKTDPRDYNQKASLYSQLRKIFENEGNIIKANLYHSLAMNYQQKIVTYKLKTSWRQKSGRTDTLFDWLGFGLNRISNNHGESWWRALRFTSIITLFTFIAATWSMKYHFSWDYIFTKKGWQFITDFQLLSDYFYKLPGFFLPTHKLEYLSEGTGYSPTFGHYCWDIVSRIFIGYGIYQFISAFRRHSRKGS